MIRIAKVIIVIVKIIIYIILLFFINKIGLFFFNLFYL